MIVLKTPSSSTKFAPHCLAGVKLFTGTDLWITWSAMVNATFMRAKRQTRHRRMRDYISKSSSSRRRRQEFLYTLFHGGDVLYQEVIKMESVSTVLCIVVYCNKTTLLRASALISLQAITLPIIDYSRTVLSYFFFVRFYCILFLLLSFASSSSVPASFSSYNRLCIF